MQNVRPISSARSADRAPNERECWLAGLTAGRAEGLDRALAALESELLPLGVSPAVVRLVLARVTARALRA